MTERNTRKQDETEEISEEMETTLVTTMEFYINTRRGGKGAVLRITAHQGKAPSPDIFTAPRIDYLFDAASLLLDRMANSLRKGLETRHEMEAAMELLTELLPPPPEPTGGRN